MFHYIHLFTALFQATSPLSVDLPSLLASFLALAGWASLVAVLVNAGKFFKLVPDGAAPNVSLILNVIGFAVLAVVRVFRPDFDVASTDALLATVATTLASVLGLLSQFGISKVINNGVKGLPVIGFSHTRQLEKAKTKADAETVAALRSRR